MGWLNLDKKIKNALPFRPSWGLEQGTFFPHGASVVLPQFRRGAARLQTLFESPAAALLATFGFSAWLYWYAFVKPLNLLEWYKVPRLDSSYLYQFGKPALWHYILGFTALALLYFLGQALARRIQGRMGWVIVLGGSLLFGLVLLYMTPFDSADIYDNIVHGRILGVYNDNPFVQVGRSYFPRDPFVPFMGWKFAPSAYGPVWELLAGLTAKAFGRDMLATVAAFKALAGVFVLPSAIVLALLLRKVAPKQALAGTLLFAWNPVVLYETWGNGHNDIVMIFWVLLAALALFYRRYTLAILALLVGALIKYMPVLMIPLAGMIALVHLKNWRQRLRFILVTSLASLVLVYLAWDPFWSGPLSNLKEILTVDRRMKLFSATLPATLLKAIDVYRPELNPDQVARQISLVAFSLTILFALVQMLLAGRDEPWKRFAQSSFNILAFYLLFTNLWWQQWYVLWLLALAPLLEGRSRRLALLFGFFALSKQFYIAPHLFWKPPLLDQPALELQFTLGSLGLPLVYGLWAAIRTVWQPRRVEILDPGLAIERLEDSLASAQQAFAAASVDTLDTLLESLQSDRRRPS